jgi:sterol desaturase/sphingolipid hydroxylase (fatty acid hydroxylase superfamily)
MSQISFNQLFVGLPFSFFTYQLYLIKFNWDEAALEAATTQTLPSFTRLVMEVAIFVVFEELMFFYSHLALHKSRYLYSKIHKKHHEWQATVAYAAIYAHPIEHIMSNIGPPAIGPLICGSHVATTWLWYALVVVTTLNSHSGYHLPLMPSPEAHDFHHLRYNQCFGTLGLLDYLHGTDDLFRSNKAYQRHITLTSLKSAREKFPDARCVEDEKNK